MSAMHLVPALLFLIIVRQIAVTEGARTPVRTIPGGQGEVPYKDPVSTVGILIDHLERVVDFVTDPKFGIDMQNSSVKRKVSELKDSVHAFRRHLAVISNPDAPHEMKRVSAMEGIHECTNIKQLFDEYFILIGKPRSYANWMTMIPWSPPSSIGG